MNMNCPCCSQEMARGYLRNANQPLQWIPDGKRPSMWKLSTVDHGVTLNGEYTFGKGYTAETYYCSNCRIVIAKTEK